MASAERRSTDRVSPLAHASYDAGVVRVPDTYIEPFTAYRVQHDHRRVAGDHDA